MRITGLVASPRGDRSTTRKLVEAALDGAAGMGTVTGIVDLSRLKIGRCKGCGSCFRTGMCVQDDDLVYALESMLKSDGIVFGSPAYASGVTPAMGALIERMGESRHCLLLEGKYGLSVSVSRDVGEGLAIARMNDFLMACGVTVTGGTGAGLLRRGSMDRALVRCKRLGEDLFLAVAERRRYPDQEDVRVAFIREFGAHVSANKERWAHDYFYWVKKGWIH